MMETMVAFARQPETQWWVLAIAAFALLAEIVRTSRETLWGDFFDEDIEEDYL